jgi:hypothetical protein
LEDFDGEVGGVEFSESESTLEDTIERFSEEASEFSDSDGLLLHLTPNPVFGTEISVSESVKSESEPDTAFNLCLPKPNICNEK